MPAALAYDELVAGACPAAATKADLSLVFDLPVELAVEIGRTTMTIRETLAIGPGSLIQLNRLAGEPVDLLVNGHRIARGEVVAIDEEFGLRVTEIVSPEKVSNALTRERVAPPGCPGLRRARSGPRTRERWPTGYGCSYVVSSERSFVRADARIWETRDSVTPSMRPISAPCRPCT